MPARGAKRVGHGSCLRAQSHWWTARGGETESDEAVRGRRVVARVRMYSYDTVLGMEPPGLLIMSFIIFHDFPWTARRHFGWCGQSCGCCRSHNPEDGENCEECYAGWILTTVSRGFRDMTQKYARKQLHLDQGWWWWGEGWWWGDWSEETRGLRVFVLSRDDEDERIQEGYPRGCAGAVRRLVERSERLGIACASLAGRYRKSSRFSGA